jgi:coenzyme F420-reducing hydrogenase alpha subunit
MYRDEYPYSLGENTTHYINRTWECHQFDTCIHGCISNMIETRTATLKERFKAEHGYKVLTAPRKTEFEQYLANDNQIKEYNELINKIK